jgi:hypothetical protein
MNWIRKEDSIPEIHQRVILWFRSSPNEWGVRFGERTYDGHFRPEGGNGNFDDDVSHWMLLPEPPEHDHDWRGIDTGRMCYSCGLKEEK